MVLTHSYIGKKECGCVVAATVIDGQTPESVAADVADFIRGGLTIERVESDFVRLHFGECPHDKTIPMAGGSRR